MTRIDFYLNATSKLQIACKIASKAIGQNARVLILAPDDQIAREIDRLMWTAPATGFLPHCQVNDPLAAETPILISRSSDFMLHDDVLLNLGDKPPELFSRFKRLIEIVSCNEDDKLAARARFRFYKDRGYDLRHHNLDSR